MAVLITLGVCMTIASGGMFALVFGPLLGGVYLMQKYEWFNPSITPKA
jgi:hypothetical protein